MTDDLRHLSARVTPEAHDALRSWATSVGCTLTGIWQAFGEWSAANPDTFRPATQAEWGEIIDRARQVDEERRARPRKDVP